MFTDLSRLSRGRAVIGASLIFAGGASACSGLSSPTERIGCAQEITSKIDTTGVLGKALGRVSLAAENAHVAAKKTNIPAVAQTYLKDITAANVNHPGIGSNFPEHVSAEADVDFPKLCVIVSETGQIVRSPGQ